MKKVAINFSINPVYLFLFFLLTLIATTSFGQTQSEDIEDMVLDLTPQSFGDSVLVNLDLHFDENDVLSVTVTDANDLGGIVFVERKNGTADVTQADMPEISETGAQYEYVLDATADVIGLYFKTTDGVSSLTIIREKNIHYALMNGKLAGAFVDGEFTASLKGKPADYFKSKVDWQYSPQIEN